MTRLSPTGSRKLSHPQLNLNFGVREPISPGYKSIQGINRSINKGIREPMATPKPGLVDNFESAVFPRTKIKKNIAAIKIEENQRKSSAQVSAN